MGGTRDRHNTDGCMRRGRKNPLRVTRFISWETPLPPPQHHEGRIDGRMNGEVKCCYTADKSDLCAIFYN